MPVNKSARVDEWKTKPSKIRIAAMRIVWGDTAIVPARSDKNKDISKCNIWLVPSERTGARYTVNLARETCSCPYWRDKRKWCKHLEAARIWKARIQTGDKAGNLVALQPVPNPYRQEPWYDALVAREEVIIRELARCLGARVKQVPSGKAGQPRVPLGDILACGILGGYANRPSRRCIPVHVVEDKLVRRAKPPSPQLMRKVMKTPAVTAASRDALKQIAQCTSKVDTKFSVDATVMKTPLSQIHIQRQAAGMKAMHKILDCKVHFAMGIETFVVYGVTVTDGHRNDQAAFIPTLKQFQDFVRFDTVLADAGYDAKEHYEHVGKRGGKPIINFSDMKGRKMLAAYPFYSEAFRLWSTDDPEWMDAYGYRWLSESGNSSLKRTIKRVIRARLEQCREAEVLFAMLAYSLKWLMHARAKHNVDIPWADAKALSLIDEVVQKCAERRLKRLPKAA